MKLKDDFISYEIDGDNILVCLDSRKFPGVVKLNSSAAFIVEQLKSETDEDKIIQAMLDHFEGIDEGKAKTAFASVIEKLRSVKAIEE